MSARFLFLVPEGPDATVIDSQVVDNVVALGREGVRFDLLFFAEPRRFLAQREYYARRRREIAERTGGRVSVLPIPRRRSLLGSAPCTAVLLAELARSPGRRLVVHARTDFCGYLAYNAQRVHRGLRYVFDCRGDGDSEFLLEARANQWPPAVVERGRRWLHANCAAAVAGAEHVLCVSTVLRDRLVERHGLDPRKSTIVPCVADRDKFHLDEGERADARRELGLDGRFVVVYPGRFGRWHYTPETFAVVRGLMDADANVHLLVLTPELEAATELAAKALPAGRYTIRSAAHHEVPRYLRASDLGILLRAPDPLNEVACPTKFAEFMMSGLPVLISAGIGDCSRFVAERHAGAVLEVPDPAAAVAAVARLREEPDAARRSRIAEAGKSLSRQFYAAEMATLYRRIAEEP